MIFDISPLKNKLKNIGDREIIDLSDENDFAFISSWGIPVPKFSIVVKETSCGKVLDIEVDKNVIKFIEDVIKVGGKYKDINKFFMDLVGIFVDSRKIISEKGDLEMLQKTLLKQHKDTLITFDDFDDPDSRRADSMYKNRMSLLGKLDADFVDKREDTSIATVYISPKIPKE